MFGLMGVARMAGQPGGAWSPLSLFAASEQGAWYDPSDFSSMFQDSAGTTPVTAVGQPVGKINDKSGNNNHATQATAAARPVVSARKNLFTYTEDFSNEAWTKTNGTTAVIGATAPDGTSTAWTVTLPSGSAASQLFQTLPAGTPAGLQSVYARAVGVTAGLAFGAYDGGGSGGASSSPALTSSWQRITLATPAYTGSDRRGFWIYQSGAATNTQVEIWHPQLETGSTATTYQRVTTASDYDTAGFPYYVDYDGIDDELSTTFPDLGTDVTIARAVPMVGASILTAQTIGAGTWTDSTNHAGLVIIDRALTAGETAALTAYLDALAGV